jgi:outer membrane protein assembly factor BamB
VLGAFLVVGSTTWIARALDGWGQYQGDAQHTGAADGPAPPYRETWSFEVPTADQGASPTPSASPSASPSAGPRPNQQGLSAPVIVEDPALAVAVGPRAVIAVDVETGESAWEVDRTYGPSATPALAGDPEAAVVVYTQGSGVDDSSVMALDTHDGDGAWDEPVSLKAVSRTGVTVEGQTAFVGDDRGNVYALRASSGELLWSVRLPGRTLAPLAAQGETVVATVAGSDPDLPIVTALDAASGERMWQVEPEVLAAGATSGVIQGQTFAVGLPDRAVHAFDLADGSSRWTSRPFFSLPSPFGGGAAYEGDFVFVFFGDSTGDVRRLDGSTGELVWDYPLNSPVLRSSPVVSGSAVVVGLRDGAIVALDGASGEQLFRGAPASGLVGPLAVTPQLIVAVRGGHEAGLVAFEHDPSGTIERVPSPSDPDPVALVSSFVAATAAILLILMLPARLVAAKRGPAFDDEYEGARDGTDGDEDEDPTRSDDEVDPDDGDSR